MNYNNKFLDIINNIDKNKKKSLLLHACCAPCSSAVLERLVEYFDITIYFYNPNITEEVEYLKRKEELIKFIDKVNYDIKLLDCDYDKSKFLEISKGLENEKEGSIRCYKCYQLRLLKTAEAARKNNFDYFTTTLSISPYKNSNWLNEIGENLSKDYDIDYLYADFKKQNGYKRSIELSKEYDLYRQDYCGCIFSKRDSLMKKGV